LDQLRALPFINGGKRPEAGQSVYCFHSQVFIAKVPEIYLRIKNRREQQGKCGVCEVLEAKNNGAEPKFEVYANSTMTLCVNPAPPRNLSFIAAPRAVRMGTVPGYNVILRSGPEIKHLHIEIIPKTGTNVPAGYEELTEEIIITQDPEETANLLWRRYA
jgi:galactose-1-phosphate uridylyltransferase